MASDVVRVNLYVEPVVSLHRIFLVDAPRWSARLAGSLPIPVGIALPVLVRDT